MTTEPPKRGYVFRGESTGLYQRLAWNLGQFLSRILALILFRLQTTGLQNLPKSGGVLFVANHQSFLDPWLIAVPLPRQLHYMARDSLFKGGFLTYLLELWNAFPVKRGSADLAAIRTAVDRLDKGFVLNIFPEGTRSQDGSIGPIAPGVSLILNRCKTDIILMPVLIDGAFTAWPRSQKLPRPGKIRIAYGRPIPPAEWKPLPPAQLAHRIRAELVNLQLQLQSPHAAQSQRRLELESPK